MELPSLGKHCAEQSCKQLDFLPMKCDACHDVFCKEHYRYNRHSCSEAYKKNKQIPECPLCSKPIPLVPGSTPDEEVGRHIDTDCQSDPARERRGKVYSNRCNRKGCKGKELIPMTCDKCQKNYCIRHRHVLDHQCKGFEDSGRQISKAGFAAVKRVTKTSMNVQKEHRKGALKQTQITSFAGVSSQGREMRQQTSAAAGRGLMTQLQGSMSEEEALARAIALSMGTSPSNSSVHTANEDLQRLQQEEEDFALAQAIAQAEKEKSRSSQRQTVKVSS